MSRTRSRSRSWPETPGSAPGRYTAGTTASGPGAGRSGPSCPQRQRHPPYRRVEVDLEDRLVTDERYLPRSHRDVVALVGTHPLAWVVSRDFQATLLPQLAETDNEGSLPALLGHIPVRNPQRFALERSLTRCRREPCRRSFRWRDRVVGVDAPWDPRRQPARRRGACAVLPAAVEHDDGREVRAACHVHESRSVESSTTPSCLSGRVARSRVSTIATPNTGNEPEVAA